MKRVSFSLCLLISAAGAHPVLGMPSGAEIVRQVRQATAQIRDYTVDLYIHVVMEGVNVPNVSVRVYHKRPDKTKLQPLRGFAILPKGALFTGDPFAGLDEGFTAGEPDEQTLAGRPVYRLKLISGDNGAPPVEIWVDRERWSVLRLVRRAPTGGALTLDIDYRRVQDLYWLPFRSTARLALPGASTHPGANGADIHSFRAPRVGTLIATFKNYRINTGLSDSLFREDTAGRTGGRE